MIRNGYSDSTHWTVLLKFKSDTTKSKEVILAQYSKKEIEISSDLQHF